MDAEDTETAGSSTGLENGAELLVLLDSSQTGSEAGTGNKET